MKGGETALMNAANNGCLEVVSFLKEAGADWHVRDGVCLLLSCYLFVECLCLSLSPIIILWNVDQYFNNVILMCEM